MIRSGHFVVSLAASFLLNGQRVSPIEIRRAITDILGVNLQLILICIHADINLSQDLIVLPGRRRHFVL